MQIDLRELASGGKELTFDRVLAVNVKSIYLAAREVVPRLQEALAAVLGELWRVQPRVAILSAAAPRFLRWRQQWDHRFEARATGRSRWAETPSLWLGGDRLLLRLDTGGSAFVVTTERARRAQTEEVLQSLWQQSVAALPASFCNRYSGVGPPNSSTAPGPRRRPICRPPCRSCSLPGSRTSACAWRPRPNPAWCWPGCR